MGLQGRALDLLTRGGAPSLQISEIKIALVFLYAFWLAILSKTRQRIPRPDLPLVSFPPIRAILSRGKGDGRGHPRDKGPRENASLGGKGRGRRHPGERGGGKPGKRAGFPKTTDRPPPETQNLARSQIPPLPLPLGPAPRVRARLYGASAGPPRPRWRRRLLL